MRPLHQIKVRWQAMPDKRLPAWSAARGAARGAAVGAADGAAGCSG